MPFADRLTAAILQQKSPLCVGLDPHFSKIPSFLTEKYSPTEAIEIFLSEILDAVFPFCVAVKPNLAFFEIWGAEGWRILESISQKAKKKGLFVIADGKRNDIGTTATAYAEAFLSASSPYDALTITPYLGEDGILPFAHTAQKNEKGIFVLVKTSNPSSGQFQDLPVGDALLHEEVARMVARVGSADLGESGFSSVGAVVGATHSDDLRILRSEMPAQIFLVPGYGAQGGSADDVAGAFFSNGSGALINSSRGICFADATENFAQKAGEAAEIAQRELWAVACS